MTRQRKTRRIRKHIGGEANRVRSHLKENIDKLRVLRRRSVTNKNLVKKLNNSIAQAEKLASETNNSNPEISLKQEMNTKANNLERLLETGNRYMKFEKNMERRKNESIEEHAERLKLARQKHPHKVGVNNETSRWDPFVATQH